MPFAKIRMGEEEIFTTIVEDLDGRILDKWKVMKRDFSKVVKILNKKFDLKMKIIEKDKSKDLDWALD